jgi:hypothetical protein
MQHCVSLISRGPDSDMSGACSILQPGAERAVASTLRSNKQTSALSQRRGEALRALFPKLASWFEASVERARRREIEAYLSRSTDIADLERRILRLQRDTQLRHIC